MKTRSLNLLVVAAMILTNGCNKSSADNPSSVATPSDPKSEKLVPEIQAPPNRSSENGQTPPVPVESGHERTLEAVLEEKISESDSHKNERSEGLSGGPKIPAGFKAPSESWLETQTDSVKNRVQNNNLVIGIKDGKRFLGVKGDSGEFLTWPDSECSDQPQADGESKSPIVFFAGSSYPIMFLDGTPSKSF